MSIKTPLNANGQIEDFIKILHTTTSAQEVNASVNTYLFNFLGIEESQKSEDEKLLISNNFIHLMCQVIDDLRIIDERLTRYNNEREQLESSKTNESEYRRRKLIYFADLNRKAQNDIVNFLNYGIKDYLQSTNFDTLQMQLTNKNDLYSRRRYMFSLVSDYYEADFDYSTVVKISHIPEENPLDIPEKEKKYILLRQKSPQQYYTNIRLLIEHNKILEYLKEHGREPKAVYHSDPDAHYVREYTFDLSKVEPVVAKPDFVDNLAPAKDVRGIKIDEAFLGSCNNGRIEDLRVGAQVIKGKKVSEKVRFLVVPASQTIYRQALEEGLIDIFMDAGAIVMNPNCSVCWGSCQGVIGENEVLISTGTRNFKGRAGHPSSKVYLGSAATVTASAIAGEIALASDV